MIGEKQMKLQAEVEKKISKSVKEVFEAIVDPEKMSRYFITSGSSRLEEGKTIWKWDDVGAELPITLRKSMKSAISSHSYGPLAE
jgi:uncharacterized protein YndB with AHSA1/START domain